MAKSPSPDQDLGVLHAALTHARHTHKANVEALAQAQKDHERSRQTLHDSTARLDAAVRQILGET